MTFRHLRTWKIQQSFLLHRFDFVFAFAHEKFKRPQSSVILSFAANMQKAQGQTLNKIILDFRTNFFLLVQVHVGILRVRTSDDVLMVHYDEDTPQNAHNVHPMLVIMKNTVLKEALHYIEGR